MRQTALCNGNVVYFSWFITKKTYSDKISLYAYLYAYEKGLRDYDLTGFVTIISGLLTDMSASFGSPRKEDMEIENKAIDFLNSLEFVIEKDAPQRDYGRAKGVIHFVLNLYLDNQHTKLVKTTISLPESYIIKIKNSVEGSSFSDKCRNLIFDYFEKNEL